MSMYLKLFHGRVAGAPGATTYEGDALDDWGHCGPTFGPITYAHTTYGVHINIEFTKEDADRSLNITNGDVVSFNGHEYGDWSVYEANAPNLGCGSEPFFERCKGSDVCEATLTSPYHNITGEILARTNVLISTGEHFDQYERNNIEWVRDESHD